MGVELSFSRHKFEGDLSAMRINAESAPSISEPLRTSEHCLTVWCIASGMAKRELSSRLQGMKVILCTLSMFIRPLSP